jgi:hypothetical protein
MTALRRLLPADSSFITGLVLDSATIDWNAILDPGRYEAAVGGFLGQYN